jgi:hypothetical protein
VLGQPDLLAAELGQGEVGDLEVWPGVRVAAGAPAVVEAGLVMRIPIGRE